MTERQGREKPKIVWVGNTPVTRITDEEQRRLHKLMKKRLAMRCKKYPEVRGKVVDYITNSVDHGTVYFTVWFKDRIAFSLRRAARIRRCRVQLWCRAGRIQT